MRKDRRPTRDPHALTDDGMVLCNARDKEAAHRAESERIAAEDRKAVTWRNCLTLLHQRERAHGVPRSTPGSRGR